MDSLKAHVCSQDKEPTAPECCLTWALDICREHGLRRTKALRALLQFLFQHEHPIVWSELSKAPAIREICDPSSAFRVLIKLEEIGLVRRVGSTDRSYYFTLKMPGKHHDYLICTACGKIENLDMACPVEKVEKQIKTATGYQKLYHELDFFGICPACQ